MGYDFVFYNRYDGSPGSHTHLVAAGTSYVLDWHGFGYQGIEIPMQRGPYMNGAMVIGTPFTAWPPPFAAADWPVAMPYLKPRTMEIALHLMAASHSALQSAYETLCHGLTPYAPVAQGVTSYLEITLPDASVRDIECYCTGVSDLDWKGPANAEVVLTFLAPSPFFHQQWDAGYEEWNTGTNPKTFTNSGDAPLWPVIRVFGRAGGTVAGLHLYNNTTNKTWSTSQTIATGAANYIAVYMDRAQMDYYNGAANADIITKLDTDAEFWPFIVGSNEIEFASTGTPSLIAVYHMWYYLGI